MKLTHVETFLKVAQLQSFSAAADALNVSKGLVSRHIKSLEAALQCSLLHRTTRCVTLTEAGHELFVAAVEIEVLTHKASNNIKRILQDDHGVIRFTVPKSLGCQLCKKAIPDFVHHYPNVKIDLEMTNELKDIEFGEFDIALRTHDNLPNNVIARNLGSMKNILVASPEWVSRYQITTPNDLNHAECIQNSVNKSWNHWPLFSDDQTDKVISTNGNLTCSSYEGIRSLALSGLGLANLPIPLVEEYLNEGQLVRVLPQWYSVQHHFHLVYAQQQCYSQKLKCFIETLLCWRNENEHWFL